MNRDTARGRSRRRHQAADGMLEPQGPGKDACRKLAQLTIRVDLMQRHIQQSRKGVVQVEDKLQPMHALNVCRDTCWSNKVEEICKRIQLDIQLAKGTADDQ